MDARLCDQPAQYASRAREHQAFNKQRPDDSPSTRAEGDSKGDLPRPADRPGEHEVREVGASDQKNKCDGAPHSSVERNRVRAYPKFVKIPDLRNHGPI